MSANSPSYSNELPSFQLSVFLRTLAGPLILWLVLVLSATIGGQPGVVCITPMGWLLSLYSGGQYIRLSGGRLGRWPLLGPALAGAALGLCMGILFILVITFSAPLNTPGDAGKAILLDAFMVLGGIFVCSLLSVFTGWLMLSHYPRKS